MFPATTTDSADARDRLPCEYVGMKDETVPDRRISEKNQLKMFFSDFKT